MLDLNRAWLPLCLILNFFASSAMPAHSQNSDVPVPGGTARLTFADEFQGSSLDRKKWTTNYTNVLANLPGELQIYVPDSFDVGQGTLKIRATKRQVDGYQFTSGAMTTYGALSQTYGYFETRARVPAGKGLWPALWMLPEDKGWPPEIDIMEFLGRDVKNIWMTYHWNDADGRKQKDGSAASSDDWTKDFHKYGLQWRPGLLIWYVDGQEAKRLTGPQVPAAPMFLLANLAIGGEWAGPPDSSTNFPAAFEIDYVRAYQYDDIVEAEAAPRRHLVTTASKQVVKPGDEVTFTFGIETKIPTENLRFQAALVDSTGKRRISTWDTPVPAAGPGALSRSWTYNVPPDLPKGLYIVSFGIFTMDWKLIDWLNNGITFLVQ